MEQKAVFSSSILHELSVADESRIEQIKGERVALESQRETHRQQFNQIFSNHYFDFSASESDPSDEEAESEEISVEEEVPVVPVRIHPSRKRWGKMDPRLTDEEVSAEFYSTIREPAMTFPFELDSFQKQAILHIHKRENVLVSAHTSSGKTVVAEYAIAQATRNLSRAIYTSPIKTLSNQKYREFSATFEDVGIVTGDVSLNPEASCLILTTEILRSMLYRGSDMIHQVEWVIFDEIHYINDVDRGVVWEEVIIMLPSHVNIIMLSATVPNTLEFANWVGRTKQKDIFVVSTGKRPIPLQHYLWSLGEMHLIANAEGQFLRSGFKDARLALMPEKIKDGKQSVSIRMKKPSFKNQWIKLIRYLEKRQLIPVVVFCLSKRKCESSISGLSSLDLCTSSEKSEIHIMIESAMERLSESDRTLPQILRISEMLKRGIGIHHSGLLPLVKELVEMVFSRGLVRVLFATETFAMGVNMPTKTVVFDSLRKYDGRVFRDIMPGEYTQMAGRAGRRGLDTFGMVIINCIDELPQENEVHRLIFGKPTKLSSQFKLSYNMIVNLLRAGDLRIEDIIKRSFSEFHSQRQIPHRKLKLEREEKLYAKMITEDAIDCMYDDSDLITKYQLLQNEISELNAYMMRTILSSKVRNKIFCPGRVVSITKFDVFERPGIILNHLEGEKDAFICLVLVPENWTLSKRTEKAIHCESFENWIDSKFWITSVTPSNFTFLMNERLEIDPTSILLDRRPETIHKICDTLAHLEQSQSIQVLDPINDLPIGDIEYHEAYRRLLELSDRIMEIPCHSCPKVESHFEIAQNRFMVRKRIELLQQAISDENIALMFDLSRMLDVLVQLQYVGSDHTILVKGKVACEFNTCECVLATEMLFENILHPLEIEEIVALLSCFVFQQKVDDAPELTEGLVGAKDQLLKLAKVVVKVQQQNGVVVSEQDYIEENINIGLMQVVYEWAKGTAFADICKITAVEEGVIVRTINRIAETVKDVQNAAFVLGDTELYDRMDKASELIKRDIISTASLYL